MLSRKIKAGRWHPALSLLYSPGRSRGILKTVAGNTGDSWDCSLTAKWNRTRWKEEWEESRVCLRGICQCVAREGMCQWEGIEPCWKPSLRKLHCSLAAMHFKEKIEAETWKMKAVHDRQSEGRWQRNPLCLPLAWSSSEKLRRLNCQLDLPLSWPANMSVENCLACLHVGRPSLNAVALFPVLGPGTV